MMPFLQRKSSSRLRDDAKLRSLPTISKALCKAVNTPETAKAFVPNIPKMLKEHDVLVK